MRDRKRVHTERKKGAPAWMVTFSDLITLILVFFILMFSMSQIDIVKFKAVANSFKTNHILDFDPSPIPFDPLSTEDVHLNEDSGEVTNIDPLNELVVEIQLFLQENGLEDVIVANRYERGVVLVLQEQVLFNTAEAIIQPSAYPFLDKVGNLLDDMSNLVKVEGHTDDRPIETYRYPSNWELSTARASSVIRYLIEEHQLDDIRFEAVGFSDTRPVAPNSNPENWEKNRRVEIVISDPEYIEQTN
ncbi:flagellar motor protein MotS [Cytobacillus sp. IB215665]|uniref:flagellar motor protein MotS n=1 Tax=Cytobacillus sp. IB215665 TaxID=3097357 RepID=UPI002A0C746C|nr:flagellar motor protein MotS [Cytobacillus sp. IB215665]MDX8367497.1 flagellar motor protein MotS [Cytobacillus sp. IB215665]